MVLYTEVALRRVPKSFYLQHKIPIRSVPKSLFLQHKLSYRPRLQHCSTRAPLHTTAICFSLPPTFSFTHTFCSEHSSPPAYGKLNCAVSRGESGADNYQRNPPLLRKFIDVLIDGKECSALIDTGAAVCVMRDVW